MSVTVKVEGLNELQKALRQLPDSTAKGVARRVLKKAGEPVAQTARQLVPVKEGHLRDSIGVSTKLSKTQRRKHRKIGKDDIEMFIGAGPLPQAHHQEFGTKDHPAQPFMRPAWDKNKRAVLEGIKGDLWEEIRKTAERVAKRAAKAAAGKK